jgi:hypothetical protein
MRLRLFLAALCACAGLAVHASQVSKPATPTGTGFILGRVVDADTGRGISGALVTLAPPPAPTSPIGELTEARPPAPPTGLTLQTGASSRRTLTALDGRFLFRDLPKGSFAIYASSSRHVPGAYGQLRYQGPAQTIVLAEGERQGAVTVKLWRFGSISGIVRDENGEPAVGVGVECSRRPETVRDDGHDELHGRPRHVSRCEPGARELHLRERPQSRDGADIGRGRDRHKY